MADVNIKLRRGALSALPTAKTDGHLYFATVDDTAASDDKKYTGYIYLDSNGQRYSFGKYVEYADQAGSATTAGTAGEADHAGSADKATTADSATKAGQFTTARYIDGMSFNGTADIHHYTTCSTAAGTAAKTASLSGFALQNGARVIVKFANANTATSNVTLNVQNTGAKKITYKGSDLTTTDSWEAGTTIEFVYNGTSWEMLSSGSGKAIYDGSGNVISDTYAKKENGIYYISGTGSTAGTWIGSHDDIVNYYDGLVIAYKIPVAGADETTLNINNLGAIKVYKNTDPLKTHLPKNTIVLLTYVTMSGVGRWVWSDYDSNTSMRLYRQTSGYDGEYPLLVSRTAAGSVGTAGENGKYANIYGVFREKSTTDHSPTLTANPAKGTVTANTFIGNLQGNADSATMATNAEKDDAGNVISDFYMPKTGGQFIGPISFKDDKALPSKTLQFLLGIDAFAQGGQAGWQATSGVTVGNASTAGTANHANTAGSATTANTANSATTAGHAGTADTANGLSETYLATLDDRYVNVTGDTMTGRLTLPYNGTGDLNLRSGHEAYDGIISYQTAGNEAMVFSVKHQDTSFIFATGEDTTNTLPASEGGNGRWQSLTPGLQIKHNCVSIGKLIANGAAPTHKLHVEGSTKVTGDIATGGALSVTGVTTLGSSLSVTGAATLDSTLNVADKATVKQLVISNTDAASHIAFSRGSLNYVTTPDNGGVAFIPDGKTLAEANSNLVIREDNVVPGATNTFSLGTNSRRWKSIYGNTLNISGTSTFTGAITASGGLVGNVTGNLTGNADSATYATEAGVAASATTAESADVANGLTNSYLNTLDTRYNAKYMKDYTVSLYNGTAGNPKPVKFTTINYSDCDSNNGVSAKIGMVSGHGNGVSYVFLQDAIINVSYTGAISVENFKYYGASAGTYASATRQYGDIFWVHDATNKIVDFYCLMGQYSTVYQTPWKRLNPSTKGTVTQHTSCTVYSSGTQEWGKNSDIALLSDIPTNFIPTTGGTITGSLGVNGSLTVGADTSIGGDLTVTGLLTATGGVKGSLDGNAKTADTFSSGTTVKLTGDVTGESASSTKGWSVATSLPYRLKNYQTASGLTLTNPNDALETGFYYINGAANRPSFSQSTNNDYRILTTAYSNIWGQQIATDFRCNDIFFRRIENGTWKDWIQFITSENLESRAKQVLDDRYVNVAGDTMTGRLNLPHNGTGSLNLRTASGSYDGIISYQTAGNEAMVFSVKNAVTSFMFVNGEDTITNLPASAGANSRWQSLTPGLQIKNNCVSIGALIGEKVTPTYKLHVAGTTNITGDTTLGNALNVTGVTTLGSTLDVTGATTLNSTLHVAGATDVAGQETLSTKINTSNGGAIVFGKEGPNSGTMIRLDQTDGTTRLRFRASASAGAMVWEQPEANARLYMDFGNASGTIYRINSPKIAGTMVVADEDSLTADYVAAGSGNTKIKKTNLKMTGTSTTTSIATIEVSNTSEAKYVAKNSDGSVSLWSSTNRGLYDETGRTWIIASKKDSSKTYVPRWAGKGGTTQPVYFDSEGSPATITCLAVTYGGTGNTTQTANRLIYSESATKLSSSGHYASSSKIAINSTSAPTENFYVNGTGKITGNTSIGGTLGVTGLITATGGVQGNVTGNLTGTASKATADADGNTISSTYLKKSGGTMTGQLLTSFRSSVAIGSCEITSGSMEDIMGILRYSSGCMGSFNLTTAYGNVPTGWYNYIYTPHRTGGTNGAAVTGNDNGDYGNLLLMGMNNTNGTWRVRFSSGAIASSARIIESDTAYSTLGYVKKSGDTMTGNLTIANGDVQIRKESPTASSWYNGRDNALIRHVAYTGYNPILSSKTTDGSWELGPYTNNYLYFVYNTDEGYESRTNTTGEYFNSVKLSPTGGLYGAVWNDYAEFRDQSEEVKPGYCVASADNGKVYRTTERLQACDGIVSDTFGFAIGEDENCKTPLAVAGRVLAYYHGDKNDYHSGDVVCAGPDGKVCKMTREEIREWPDRIIGIVSEIPTYETWGGHNTKVNNRIWINVK